METARLCFRGRNAAPGRVPQRAAADYSSMQWGIVMARIAKFAQLEPDDAMFILKWLQTSASASDART